MCDITLATEDGVKVKGHKIIFASASPYFHAMFSSFEEKEKDIVVLKNLDSTALISIVDYIYTGEIMLNEENIQVEDILICIIVSILVIVHNILTYF